MDEGNYVISGPHGGPGDLVLAGLMLLVGAGTITLVALALYAMVRRVVLAMFLLARPRRTSKSRGRPDPGWPQHRR